MTLEEKVSQMGNTSPAIKRLGIPEYDWWNECLHGVARAGIVTVFPQAIGMAATWHQELIYRVAKAISDEARAKHHKALAEGNRKRYYGLTFWTPVVNMARDPRWGRTQETYGEDPYLTSRMGVAFIKGLQGEESRYLKLVATPKHYAMNNDEERRHTGSADVNERQLREYYLPQFEACVREGRAQSIMGAYNAVNGVPCCANPFLLKEILREEWGFSGYVVSDCGAIDDIYRNHHYAKSLEEASAKAVKAGCDLNCGEAYPKSLLKAVQDGLISEKVIDQAVTRLFKARFQLGMFDPPERVPFAKIPYSVVDSPKHRELALQTALESMVLLKNEDHFLPLSKELKSIAVVGPNANSLQFGNYSGQPSRAVTPLEGIRNKVSEKTVVRYARGCEISSDILPVISSRYLVTEEKTGGASGLRGDYFTNKNLEGNPLFSRTDATIDFDWGGGSPDPSKIPTDKFSVRWTGYLIPPETRTYKIGVVTDDGVRFYLDGKLVVDQWVDRAATQNVISVKLEAGKAYPIQIDYFEDMGDAVVKLVWDFENAEEEKALRIARESDVVIAVLGLDQTQEAEAMDRKRIELPRVQEEFLKKVTAANPNVVLVLENGSPVAIRWANEHVPAILDAWYPGEEGGTAIADVLFGDYNPGGRLPVTFYASTDQLPPFDDYDLTKGRTYMYLKEKPLFPFGFGLSYTTFAYSGLKLDSNTLGSSDSLKLSLDIKNTGERDGDEVVQLYIRALHSRHLTQKRILKAFRRIHLRAGAARTLEFTLPISNLAYYSTKEKSFVVEPGTYEVQMGASSEDIREKAEFEIVEK
ncbi:MAG: glucan 1,4-alpha-glucosidase [Calditrichaeota bacterium]|nr:glucan 1,4-alpha-glucosidase [Calditrichota bacterium]